MGIATIGTIAGHDLARLRPVQGTTALGFIALTAALAGCPIDVTSTVNGDHGRLDFALMTTGHDGLPAPAAAIASTVSGLVLVGTVTHESCTEDPSESHGYAMFGGSHCAASDPSQSLVALVEAHCDGLDCTVVPFMASSTGGNQPVLAGVHVTSAGTGPAVLHLTVRRASGEVIDDTHALTFVRPTRIGVECDPSRDDVYCPGAYAVFPSRALAWHTFVYGLDANGAEIELSNDGLTGTLSGASVADTVHFPPPGDSSVADVLVETAHPGLVTLTVHAGDVERAIDVRVADPNHVTAFRVYEDLGTTVDPSAYMPLGAVPTAVTLTNRRASVHWIVGATLDDGTVALGARPEFVDMNGVVAIEAIGGRITSIDAYGDVAGPTTIYTTLGALTWDWPLTVN